MKKFHQLLGLLGVMLSVSCSSTKLGGLKNLGGDGSNPYAYEDVAGAMSGTEDFSTNGLASGGAATQYSDYLGGGGATDQNYASGEQATVAPFSDYGNSTNYDVPSYTSSSPKRSASKPKTVVKKSTSTTRTVVKHKSAPEPKRIVKNTPSQRHKSSAGKKGKVELVSRDVRRTSTTQKAVYHPKNSKKGGKVTKTAAVAKPKSYTIKKGDTLTSISSKTGVPINTLKKKNNISGSKIQAGKSLNL